MRERIEELHGRLDRGDPLYRDTSTQMRPIRVIFQQGLLPSADRMAPGWSV